MITFNLNENVFVKLTPFGKKIMKENHDRFYKELKIKPVHEFSLPKEDERGYSKWQMWSLMQEFEGHIGMGKENPYELTILIEES